jgi:hypothetical protein
MSTPSNTLPRTRLTSLVQVGFWLGVSVLVLNVVLHGLEATPALSWLPKAVSGTGFLEDNKLRVSAAFEDVSTSHQPVATIIGISNVREDINLAVLSEAAQAPTWQFLGIGGAGLGIRDLAEHAQIVLDSDLRPRLVVLGFGLHQLVDLKPGAAAGPGGPPVTGRAGILDYLKRGDLRNVASSMRAWLWFFSRRQDVAIAADKALLAAREWTFKQGGVKLPRPKDGATNPYREMIKSGWPEHFSTGTLKEEEAFLEGLGAFDATAYQKATTSPTQLAGLVNDFEQRGAHVVLLLMPDHPVVQRRIPVDARAALDRVLAQAREAPSVLDFRNLIEDPEGFVDLVHLNTRGSAIFSTAAGKALHGLLQKAGSSSSRSQ